MSSIWDRETVYVEDLPKRLLGNLLIDGPDGQCAYIYSGIETRCQNEAVAHTYTDHGGELVPVEMCAEHAREEVPEPPTVEQKELVTDGGPLTKSIPAMKFANQYVQPILRGHKTATVRLELDEPFNIGDRFHLCREDGERFASSNVTDRGYNDAESIVRYGVEGHKDYRDVHDFIRHLSRFYPDEEIGPSTCFEIVYWEEVWE